ncbi:MAG: mechanosensitive ion channel [Muriicola sp.]|nr:mechanosensitive ion channel [Muriicola sp.]NNK10046.1 mechanosensitive ion channel [Flavobacteriaceae bacterium]
MDTLGSLATDSLTTIIQDIVSALPGILGAIIVLLIGWLIIKIIGFVLKKILKLARVDALSEKINEARLFGEESKIKIDVIKILLGFIKGILWITFIIVAAEIMGLTIISTEISNLLRYLPVLLSAVVIFMIGMYAAKLIKSALTSIFDSMGIGGSKVVSSIVYYMIIVFVLITSLNQAGIDTAIITSNITLVIGAFLLAFAIGLGLGSREVVAKLLNTFYARRAYTVGDAIKTKKFEGTIEAIEGILVTLKTKEGKIVIPIEDLIQTKVELK